MKLLAIDSTTQRCSVALMLDAQLNERIADGSPQHADMLLPLVHELLSAANCALRELDAIAFWAGPGHLLALGSPVELLRVWRLA